MNIGTAWGDGRCGVRGRCLLWVKLRRTQCEQMSSELPLKADIAQYGRHVSKVPISEVRGPFHSAADGCSFCSLSCQRNVPKSRELMAALMPTAGTQHFSQFKLLFLAGSSGSQSGNAPANHLRRLNHAW